MINVKGNLRFRFRFQSLWIGLKSYLSHQIIRGPSWKSNKNCSACDLHFAFAVIYVNNLKEPHSSESGLIIVGPRRLLPASLLNPPPPGPAVTDFEGTIMCQEFCSQGVRGGVCLWVWRGLSLGPGGLSFLVLGGIYLPVDTLWADSPQADTPPPPHRRRPL